jgi:hypothetical protein
MGGCVRKEKRRGAAVERSSQTRLRLTRSSGIRVCGSALTSCIEKHIRALVVDKPQYCDGSKAKAHLGRVNCIGNAHRRA